MLSLLYTIFASPAVDLNDLHVRDHLAARKIDRFIWMQREALHFNVNQPGRGKLQGDLLG